MTELPVGTRGPARVGRPREGRARTRRPSFAPVLWGSISLFAILFAFLTYEFSAGRDPSLASTGRVPSRPVVLRKVVKRRVVTTVVPTPGPTSVSSGPVTTSPAPEVPSYEPVVTASS